MTYSEDSVEDREVGAWSSSHVVHEVLQFGRALRYRKHIVIACLIVACLLGALYYVTTPRSYRAHASLLVLQTGSDVWSSSMTPEASRQGMLPTYERLFTSAVVLEGALQELQGMPREVLVDLASLPRERWVEQLRANLSARSLRLTNLIEINYRSRHPQAAEAIVNAVVQSYLSFMEANHKDVAGEIAGILQRELVQVEGRLVNKNRELLDVKKRVRDLGLREGSNVLHPVVQRVVRINEALVEVQQRRMQLDATLTAVREAAGRGGDLRQHLLAIEPIVGREVVLTSLGLDAKDNELVKELELQLISDRAGLRRLDAHFGPAHPRVAELTGVIRQAEQYLANYDSVVEQRLASTQGRRLSGALVAMVEEELGKSWMHERQLQQQYDKHEEEAVRLNGQIAEVTIIEHDLGLLRKLHDTLMNRIDNLEIAKKQSDVRVAVVSEPKADVRPVSPRLSMVVLLCLLGGLGGGAVVVYVMDIVDDRFRSPEELKQQLNVPILAMVRQLSAPDQTGAGALQVHVAPDSVESEAFRTLRTTLAFAAHDADCIAVSSSEPGDGKTTVLANLGVASAQAGKKTLLIDGDMRRPGLSKLFGCRAAEGLANVLRAEGDLATMCIERIQPTDVDGLDVLPCGRRPSDPTGLLSGARFADLLAWAENLYDFVIIDSPPILAASDATIVGRMCDGLVLVVQPQKNHRRLVLRAVDSMNSLDLNLLGVVVNRIDTERGRGYYGAGYGYGYGYGYGDGYQETQQRTESLGERASLTVYPDEDAAAGRYFKDGDEPADGRITPRRAA